MKQPLFLSGFLAFAVFRMCATAQSNFGTVSLTASKTEAVTVTLPAAATLSGISVRTQGVEKQDFTDVEGGTCRVGKRYAKGADCTVRVAFSPRYPGTRYGAVVLMDSSAAEGVAAIAYVQGAGLGPQTAFGAGAMNQLYNLDTYYPVAVALAGTETLFLAQAGAPVSGGFPGNVLMATLLPNGNIAQTFIGRGLISPSGVAVDGGGNVYITDLGNLSTGSGPTGPAAVYKETRQADSGYKQTTIGTRSMTA